MMQKDFWTYSTGGLIKYTVFLSVWQGIVLCTVIHKLVDDGLVFNFWQLQVLVWGALLHQHVRILLRRVKAMEPAP